LPQGSQQNKTSFGRQFQRRAIVNVRYASAKKGATWKAHGRYVERESAAGDTPRREEDRLGMAKDHTLDKLASEWQAAGDPRLFKIIVSPEDGARADFERTASDMMTALEAELGSKLQWAGVVHRNTAHPHAHLIVRGITHHGTDFTIPRSVVKNRLREAVEGSLTRQLGFRTLDDVREEREAEVGAFRVTSIDRAIAKSLPKNPLDRSVIVKPASELQQRRFRTLEKMGLATRQANGDWMLRSDFQKQLQQMKDLQDRARTLFQSGVAISDPHAPMEYLERTRKLIGRVLLTSEEERTGSLQTAFETIDGKIVVIKHDSTLRGAWVRGDLKAGNVVSIDSLKRDPSRLYAAFLGEDKSLLRDDKSLVDLARRIRNMSLIVTESDKGWIGELTKALASRQREQESEQEL
jgi:type IV secretory pathway VirD2 relaxase